MSNNKQRRAEVISRAEAILQSKPLTHEHTALFNGLMKLSDVMLVDGEQTNTEASRAASLRVRDAILGEARTYSPMSDSGQPQLIAADFSAQMAQLMLSAGPMYFGSPVLTSIERSNLSPTKIPVSTDLGVGYDQTEAGNTTEQELNFSSVNLSKNTISSGIILVSQDLCVDLESWTTVEALIQRTASARLSRRQNQKFIPLLVTNLAANSSASIASATTGLLGGDDIASLVASVNGQYRSSASAGFLLNSDTARQIFNIKDSEGMRMFKHVLDPKPTLLGYPVFVSDYADSIATGNRPLIFGAWSYVYSRHVPGFELQVMKERFSLDGYQGIIIRQRGDIQYSVPSTSESALKMVTIS
jgi:HK97 family phage major capsid protein